MIHIPLVLFGYAFRTAKDLLDLTEVTILCHTFSRHFNTTVGFVKSHLCNEGLILRNDRVVCLQQFTKSEL